VPFTIAKWSRPGNVPENITFIVRQSCFPEKQRPTTGRSGVEREV